MAKIKMSFVLGVLLFSFASAFGAESAESLANMGLQKRDLILKISRYLNADLEKAKDWKFTYAAGETYMGTPLNLEIENLTYSLLSLSSEKLMEAAKEAVNDTSELSINPLRDAGRLALTIGSTDFHHSFIFGDHNQEYTTFYLRIQPATQIEDVQQDAQRLEATIKSKGSDGVTYHQKILIDRSSQPTKVEITDWDDRVFSLSQSKTIYLKSLNWSDQPKVTSHSSGI